MVNSYIESAKERLHSYLEKDKMSKKEDNKEEKSESQTGTYSWDDGPETE